MLKELFLTVCLNTSLACDDISLSYKNLNFGLSRFDDKTQAMAYMTSKGRLGIWFDEGRVKRMSETTLKQVITHEIAHLLVFQEDPIGGHGWKFVAVCRELARKVDVPERPTCAAIH